MKTKVIVLIVICSILLGNTALAVENNDVVANTTTPTSVATGNTVEQIVILQAGKVNKVRKDAIFKVVLEANASAGYSWSYTDSSKAFKMIKLETINTAKDKKIVGAPSKNVWTFKAIKKGTFKLKYTYARSWDKNKPALKTVAYTIKVL